jgi:alkylhydroperoxidase/carboxymuconolactone decarboxylase family protein YurZ
MHQHGWKPSGLPFASGEFIFNSLNKQTLTFAAVTLPAWKKEQPMENKSLPEHYRVLRQHYGDYMDAVAALGEELRRQGPIDAKHGHLIQLAAAIGIRSEGAVHSHARRALQAGATPEEIRHAVILLTSTLGFPTVSAAFSWVEDVLQQSKA